MVAEASLVKRWSRSLVASSSALSRRSAAVRTAARGGGGGCMGGCGGDSAARCSCGSGCFWDSVCCAASSSLPSSAAFKMRVRRPSLKFGASSSTTSTTFAKVFASAPASASRVVSAVICSVGSVCVHAITIVGSAFASLRTSSLVCADVSSVLRAQSASLRTGSSGSPPSSCSSSIPSIPFGTRRVSSHTTRTSATVSRRESA
mmetsp:Transcript_23743/g.51912  ORF Transcript_23743/g.51912 Transcript_23743/m.51912 type:complete len:204 (+) Transcript_23743:161-772(+)